MQLLRDVLNELVEVEERMKQVVDAAWRYLSELTY